MQETTVLPLLYKSLSSLHYWKRNYNVGRVDLIARSIERFGYARSVAVWNDVVFAGNHTIKALRKLKTEKKPVPTGVFEKENDWWILVSDLSHLNYSEAEAYAVADNSASAHAQVDEDALAQLLSDLAEHQDQSLLPATGYTQDDLDQLLAAINDVAADAPDATDDDTAAAVTSNGSLLALTNVTLDDPTHKVEPGDVWCLGIHRLICAPVITDHAVWLPYLQQAENALFAPYAGPFVALSQRAEQQPFVIVQPDPYVAGHIIDRYVEVKGDADVRRAD